MAVDLPANDYRYRSEGVSSSSAPEGLLEERAGLAPSGAGMLQPPTRRRTYGRSRYQDRLHNADGSSRIAFVGGAGLVVPVGNTGRYYTPSYNVAAGAGINFNKMFGVLGEYHYDHFGLTGGTINYQYNQYLTQNTAATLAGLDANAHVNSITVDPIINFSGSDRMGSSKVGAYVTGGVGYYFKTTNFTLPTAVQGYFGGIYYQNQTVDSYSANGFGANLGAGLSYKLSEFNSERLFVEARYDWIKLGKTNTDYFPFNRLNSEYIPITVGIRF